MNLLDPLRRAADHLDRRTRRERLVLTLAVAVVLVVAWDSTLRAPLAQRYAAAAEQFEGARADIERLQASTERLAAQVEGGGRNQGATAALERRLERVDARVAERTRRIIAPTEMVRVLRDVLADEPRLRLIALRNAGVEAIDVTAGDVAAGEDTAGAGLPTLYRHRVELVAEGRYFALLAYLQRLEGLPWQFQWDALQLETTKYPTARATLSLSTLSLAEDWIGVAG